MFAAPVPREKPRGTGDTWEERMTRMPFGAVRPREKLFSPARRGRAFDFLCTVPALLFFIVFTYYPIGKLFHISLTDWNLSRAAARFVGIKNYRWLFSGRGWDMFLSSLQITALYTVGEVVLTIAGGLALALLFSRMSKGFSVMRVAVIMPRYVLVSSTALVFMWLYNDLYGVFNHALGLIGLKAVNWLGSKDTALLSLILYSGWRVTGYAMLIYLSALRGISPQYLEAADIDGAGRWQKMRYIQLPLLAPTTLFLVITTVVSSMKVFQAVDVLTSGGPYKATSVLVYQIYSLAFADHRLDRAAAVGSVFFVLLLCFTWATMKYSSRRVSYDA